MATTYGYGGEFSSDEDIDKIEQQNSTTKFDAYNQVNKPTKSEIEQAIDTIRRVPIENDVVITDDLLAGLLDHFKTQRGPIVDSTRNLYKKIVLRLIRGEQQQPDGVGFVGATNGDNINNMIANSNGNGNVNIQVTNNVDIINNNNDLNIISKKQLPVDIPSSDEDEPMPPASQEQAIRRKFDSRVVYNNNEDDKLIHPMEVDTDVQPNLESIRDSKPVDMATTDEENSDTDVSIESEEIVITPSKATVAATQKTSTPIVNFKKTAKRADIAANKKAAASSATKDTKSLETADDIKKPYRRSQRVAATRANPSPANKSSTSISDKVVDSVGLTSGVNTCSKSALSSYEICSKSLSKIKLKEEPPVKDFVYDEKEIIVGGTINGRKLNYAEKMVLNSMLNQTSKLNKFR